MVSSTVEKAQVMVMVEEAQEMVPEVPLETSSPWAEEREGSGGAGWE